MTDKAKQLEDEQKKRAAAEVALGEARMRVDRAEQQAASMREALERLREALKWIAADTSDRATSRPQDIVGTVHDIARSTLSPPVNESSEPLRVGGARDPQGPLAEQARRNAKRKQEREDRSQPLIAVEGAEKTETPWPETMLWRAEWDPEGTLYASPPADRTDVETRRYAPVPQQHVEQLGGGDASAQTPAGSEEGESTRVAELVCDLGEIADQLERACECIKDKPYETNAPCIACQRAAFLRDLASREHQGEEDWQTGEQSAA